MQVSDPPLLRLRSVDKSFSGVPVLRDVDFDVRAGEVHALLGSNGAGKSTLMKIVEGVHAPDAGRIEVAGQEVRLRSPHDARERGIAMIFQEFSLVPHLSIAENLVLGREPTRAGLISDGAVRERAREALRAVHLRRDPTTRVARLSTGERQLVEIAKALSADARVLIMDEPTVSLTRADVEQLFGLIATLKDRGIGVIHITHRLEEVTEVADRVTVLRDGRVVVTRVARDLEMSEMIEHIVGRTMAEDQRQAPVDARERAPLLEASGLRVGDRVRDVSFTLHSGEVLGVAGLMGSGRSSLARCLFGIERPSSGAVRVRGEELKLRSPADAIGAGIALVPEDRHEQGLVLEHTVRTNLMLPTLGRLARAAIIDDRAGDRIVDDAIETLDIRTRSPRTPVRLLSGGNQQKVVLGKWLAAAPDVLILDEPTSGVDIATKADVYALIRKLAAEGKGVILISSELAELLALSDRILVLQDGRIRRTLQGDEIASEHELNVVVHEGHRGDDHAAPLHTE